MNARLEDDLRRLFGPLDPIADRSASPGEVTAADREEDLRAILHSADRIPRRRRTTITRRRALLAGAAAVVVAAGAAAVEADLIGSGPDAAFAATPPPLTYPRVDPARPASAVLEQIAARVDGLPKDTERGAYQHITILGWYLDSRTQGGTTSSAIVPRKTETWMAGDGSGRSVTTAQPPAFGTEKDRHWWSRFGGTDDEDTEVRTWSAQEDFRTWEQPAPTTPREMATFLQIGHPVSNGPAGTIRAVTDLCREQVLSPPQRAALLRVLTTTSGLRYAGPIADRSGRHGEAFVMDFSNGLPARYTVIVDAGTGRLLGWEEMLTRDAGRLNVRIPAVLSYETFLQSRYAATIDN